MALGVRLRGLIPPRKPGGEVQTPGRHVCWHKRRPRRRKVERWCLLGPFGRREEVATFPRIPAVPLPLGPYASRSPWQFATGDWSYRLPPPNPIAVERTLRGVTPTEQPGTTTATGRRRRPGRNPLQRPCTGHSRPEATPRFVMPIAPRLGRLGPRRSGEVNPGTGAIWIGTTMA